MRELSSGISADELMTVVNGRFRFLTMGQSRGSSDVIGALIGFDEDGAAGAMRLAEIIPMMLVRALRFGQ